jgi:hypothetical protein
MHRSGTSALSGVACALGASAPNNPLPANFANPSGYWESWPLVQVHDELLASADSSWDDWKALDPRWYVSDAARRLRGRLQETIRSEYEDKSLFVMKDPRVCRFLPFFLSVLEDMSISPVALFPIRNPLEVAFSLRRRDGFSISKSAALWLRHVLDAEFHSRQIPRCFISYENLLKGWRQEMDRASDAIGVKWPVDPGSAAGSIDKFLTAELHHERTESAALERNPDLSFLAAETFYLLGTASKAGAGPDLFGRLDALRERFGEASNFFGAILRNEERSIQQLRATLNQKSSELDQQRASVEEQKNHQLALVMEEQKKYRQTLIEDQRDFQQALLEQQNNYQLALIAEQQKYQQASAEQQFKHEQALKEAEDRHQHALKETEGRHQQALKETEGRHQQALKEAEDRRQQALKETEDRYQQALKEAGDRHQQALKEAEDRHQHASIDEQKKYQLALMAEQQKHQRASAEEQNKHQQASAEEQHKHEQELKETQDKHQQALKDEQNKHRQEFDRQLRQNERERDEYIARLDRLSTQLTEVNDRSRKTESHLNLMIRDLTAAIDRKRGEYAYVLADLESYRDLSEREAGKLQEIETQHGKLQADVAQKAAMIGDLKKQVEHLHATLVDRDRQVQAAIAQVNAIYTSRSWRLTRPLRVVVRLLSRLRNFASSD